MTASDASPEQFESDFGMEWLESLDRPVGPADPAPSPPAPPNGGARAQPHPAPAPGPRQAAPGAPPGAGHPAPSNGSASHPAPTRTAPAPTPRVAPAGHPPAQAPRTAAPVTTPAPTVTPPPGRDAQPVPTSAPAPATTDETADLPPLKKRSDGSVHIDDLLRYVVDVKASDLHVKPGAPPTIRVGGLLHPLDYKMLDARDCHDLATALISEKERMTLEEEGEVDFAYSLAGVGRFRVNVHRQRGSLGIAARRTLPEAPDFNDLALPPAIPKLADEHRGLLLVTGPTSSGKTTTCGAIIKRINQTRRCHIVTIEDPIEILHNDDRAVVTQREVGQDTKTFSTALRAAMRQDPDVIFVGEIRDTETVTTAIQAAETGHFVIATLHTTNVVETIHRVVDFFPPHQQKQVRVALASSLVGVITQRLLPKVGGGRAPALEILIGNGRVRDCILDPEKTHGIHDIVEESGFYGMQTFDQALIKLFEEGLVTLEDAKSAANRPHDFELALKQKGLLES